MGAQIPLLDGPSGAGSTIPGRLGIHTLVALFMGIGDDPL